MSARRGLITHQMRLAGFYIAFVAMLFRALLPVGWMPNIGGVSGIPIVLCSFDGPVPAVLGPDGQPVKHGPVQDDAHQHDVCPFASTPHFTALAAVVVQAPFSVASAVITPGSELQDPDFDSYVPQSPRGPPGIV